MGHFAGLSPQSVSIVSTLPPAREVLTDVTSVSVRVSLSFNIEPYSFATPFAAYNALNASLSSAVFGGQFTQLINNMSRAVIYSEVFASPVYSDYVMFDAFPSTAPSAQPSITATTISQAPAKNGVQSIGTSQASESTGDYTIYIIIAVVACLLLSCAAAYFWYYKRREFVQSKKNMALADLTSLNIQGEVIPEEGDPVEWGFGNSSYGETIVRGLTSQGPEDDAKNKMRKGDLFVI